MNSPDTRSSHSRRGRHALVADVGGSNARFGWLDRGTGAIEHVASLPASDFDGIVSAARHYLAGLHQLLGDAFEAPQEASVAIATAITSDRIELTNSHWSFSRSEVAAALDLAAFHVINDFEALALALPHLRPDQLRVVGTHDLPNPGERSGTLAVVGPGTGLGVATVLRTLHGWVALAGEGGHCTIAPGDGFESDLLNCLRRRHRHVSAERLLSGIGLPDLHGAVAEVSGQPSPTLDAPAIVDAGLAGEPVATQTLATFCAMLGSFAGNVALTVGARGGVFIGGGIVPRLGAFFDRSDFRRRFEDKGRLSSYLAAIPTAVITDTLAALTGAAAVVRPETQTL